MRSAEAGWDVLQRSWTESRGRVSPFTRSLPLLGDCWCCPVPLGPPGLGAWPVDMSGSPSRLLSRSAEAFSLACSLLGLTSTAASIGLWVGRGLHLGTSPRPSWTRGAQQAAGSSSVSTHSVETFYGHGRPRRCKLTCSLRASLVRCCCAHWWALL